MAAISDAIVWWLDRWAALDERERKVTALVLFAVAMVVGYRTGALNLEG